MMRGWPLLLLLFAPVVHAKPGVDPGIAELRGLPQQIVAGPDAALVERFAVLLGRYDTGALRPSDIAYVRDHAAQLEAGLIASQRPGRGLSPQVQGLLRGRLAGTSRDTVLAYLRGWLAGDAASATRRGSGESMPELAAYELVEWHDPLAERTIRGYLGRLPTTPDWNAPLLREHIQHELDRCRNACTGKLLAADNHAQLGRCGRLVKISAIELSYQTAARSGPPTVRRRMLSDDETDSLWVGLADAREDLTGPEGPAHAELNVNLDDGGSERFSWCGGDEFLRAVGSLGQTSAASGFRCATLGRLVERWISRPVSGGSD